MKGESIWGPITLELKTFYKASVWQHLSAINSNPQTDDTIPSEIYSVTLNFHGEMFLVSSCSDIILHTLVTAAFCKGDLFIWLSLSYKWELLRVVNQLPFNYTCP
jgi:hypothetical protein